MNHLPLLRCHFATATAALALALATCAGATTHDEVVTSVVSSPSSTSVFGGIAECEFDLILAEDGTFEELSLNVDGPLGNTRCKLGSIPQLEGAELEGSALHCLTMSQVSQSLPSGAVLLHCDSDEFISAEESVTIDFLDIEATVTSAVGPGGKEVAPPRLCASGISCYYEGGGELDWDGDPLCGDANYDRRIRAVDALAALRTSVGKPSCVPVQSVCDANSDLQVSASDALLILRASVHEDVTLQCPVPCHPGRE